MNAQRQRRKKGHKIDGWINLDKPEGLTSTQAIGRIRRILSPQKIGHGGTLDPMATGVLPIAMGEATKTIPFIQDALKTYSFTLTWGEERDTDDREGETVKTADKIPSEEEIRGALSAFTGEIEQQPPKFSALKVNGQRAYDLARKGQEPDLKPRNVYIERLEFIAAQGKEASLLMTCGKGTYVRALARDLGRALGTCAYLSVLRRERVGCLGAESAISLDKLEELSNSAAASEAVLSLEVVLDDIPALALKEEETVKLKNGQKIAFIARPDYERLQEAGIEEGANALAVFQDRPIALVELEGPEIKPVRVFNI